MNDGTIAVIVLLVIVAVAAIAGGLYWYFKKRNNDATFTEYSQAIATSSLHDEIASNVNVDDPPMDNISFDSAMPTASQYGQAMPANLDTSLAVGASQFPSVTAKMTSTFEMGD